MQLLCAFCISRRTCCNDSYCISNLNVYVRKYPDNRRNDLMVENWFMTSMFFVFLIYCFIHLRKHFWKNDLLWWKVMSKSIEKSNNIVKKYKEKYFIFCFKWFVKKIIIHYRKNKCVRNCIYCPYALLRRKIMKQS